MPIRNVFIAASSLIALLCAVACYPRNIERYSLSQDARQAASDIRAIDDAEHNCYQKVGHFVSPEGARRDGCDQVWSAAAKAEGDGFAVEIKSNTSDYSIRVVPSAPTRLVSLYLDQTGIIHFGTKEQPASPKTAAYNDQR